MPSSAPRKLSKSRPNILDSLGISLKKDSSNSLRVVAADLRVQKINEQRLVRSESAKTSAVKRSFNTDLSDLHKACRQGNTMDVDFLIREHPTLIDSPSSSSEDSFGKGGRAVHFSVVGDQPDVLARLLSLGADPNSKSDRGVTALHIACSKGLVECAEILLRGSAVITERDSFGQTPIGILRQDCGDMVLRGAREKILALYRRARDTRALSDNKVLSITDRILYRKH